MAKGKLILICQSGGEFITNDDGTMSYNGGEANAANVTSETPFNDLKLSLAETCDLNQETVTVKYFLPGNKRNLITVKNDKDVKRMIDFHGDAITAEVFVMGTPGFDRGEQEMETNRQNPTENDKTVKNDNLSTKKDEKIKRAKTGPKKDKKVEKEDTSSSAESEQVNVNVDSDCSSDYAPSRSAKRKKVNSHETEVNASPADSVKKRRRTPSWKIGANGRPTIVSENKNSRGSSGNKNLQRKNKNLKNVVGPSALVTCDDDITPETLVSLWKSTLTGVGQQFSNLQEFEETLTKYAIANDFEFKLKNNKNHVVGECAVEGCSWKFNAVWVPSTESFNIKSMNNVHTCEKESNNWLLDAINLKLQESPCLKPIDIGNRLLKDFGAYANRTEVVALKVISREEQLHGYDDKGAYNKLPWFCEKIKEVNPGSVVKLVIGERKIFKGVFVSFYSSLCGFKKCRPLLLLEVMSFRSKYGEVLFTANGIDGNDELFMVAFAVVDVEDEKNWVWFLGELKGAIFNSQERFTFVFDREKDLKKYVLEVFQDSHIGYSIYHLLESFKRNVKGPFHGDGKSYLPFHFLAAAQAVRLLGFKKAVEQIKLISSQAYDWVMGIGSQHWATSSFKGERYSHIIDDISRSLCKLMEEYQDLPILHKLDAIIRMMIDAVNDGKLDGTVWSTHLTPSKEKQLQEEKVKSCGLKVLISSDTLFEVREDSTHVVDIGKWSCTCLGWKETGVPCRHAIAVCGLVGKDQYEFCSSWFTVDAYRATYSEGINPVPIEKEEGEKMEVEQVGGEKEQALIVVGEKMEIEVTLGENEGGGKVGGEKMEIEKDEGEKVEIEKVEGEKVEILKDEGKKVEVEKEQGEKMEIEKVEGEKVEIEKVEGEKVEFGKDEGEKVEIEKVEGEKVEIEKVEGEKVEIGKDEGEKVEIEKVEGEKVEIEKVEGEKVEIEKDLGENEEGGKVEGEKMEIEKVEGKKVEIEKVEGEKVEIEKVEGEKVEIEKDEGEKMEILKDEGEKGKIEKDEGEKGKNREEEEDDDVLVLPPIPLKQVDVMKEKMDWGETEVETKRTVTCTKCKQPGHNKKSCNLYQPQEAC